MAESTNIMAMKRVYTDAFGQYIGEAWLSRESRQRIEAEREREYSEGRHDPTIGAFGRLGPAPDPLPRPVVTAESTNVGDWIVINVTATAGDGKSRAWSGAGSSIAGATREVVEKIFSDHHSAEYVKRG